MKNLPQKSLYSSQLDTVKELLESKGQDAVNYVDKIPIPCCVTNRNGLFQVVNNAYCQMYGYQSHEMLGKHFTMVVPEENREYLKELHDLFMGRKYELQSEFTVQNKKGEYRTIMANAAYVIDSAMNPYKITFLIDLTDKQNEVQLLQQTISQLEVNLQTRELAEGILFHDLRKPLASIIGLIEVLGNPPFDKEQTELYKMIPQLAYKSMNMIEAYGGIHRMEQGLFEPELTNYELVPQIRQLFRYLQPEASQKNISLQLEEDEVEEGFMICADQPYIELMLENILTNALQASPASDEVSVKLSRQEDKVKIRICNQGVIPQEIRHRFFDKYVTVGKAKGTGLGTYIAWLIADSHQGSISFETSEEKGTCLEVSLPLCEPSYKTKC